MNLARNFSLLIVGAFPAPGSAQSESVFGGVLQSCRLLAQSSLPTRAKLTVVDSTAVAVPPPGLLLRGVLATRRCCVFLSRFERSRPAALLIFSSSGASFIEKSLYALYGRIRGRRVLFFLRDGGFMLQARRSAVYRTFARLLLRANSVVLCQTEGWRRFFADEIGIESSRCEVVENWTVRENDLEIGKERDYRATPRMTLLFLGWIEESKGVLDLLEAFKLLLEKPLPVDVELVMAGRGSHVDRCQKFVDSNSLAGRVRFVGWVSGQEKTRILREADIFVLPSHFEGLSNAMLEAMAAGLPVVVTRVGGLPDVIADRRDGWIVEPRDVLGIRDALCRLIGDRSLRETLGLAARAKAARFGVERAVDRLLDLASPRA